MSYIESKIQQSCVQWFRLAYREPKYLIFAVPNAGKRSARGGNKMNAEGLRKGAADLVVMGKDKLFFVEMKTGDKKSKQEPDQKEFEQIVSNLGFNYYICRSFDEFKTIIDNEFKLN